MALVEKLKEDLDILQQRKDLAFQSYHQVMGAISILEQLIFRELNPEPEIQPLPEVIDVPDSSELPIEEQQEDQEEADHQ